MKKLYYLIILTVILGLVLTGCLLSNVGQVPTTEQSGVSGIVKSFGSINYGDITLSGGFQAGHFPEVWDLTDCDMVISFTYDANGLVDDFGGGAHAWAELGIREVGYGDFNPSAGSGVWLATDYEWVVNTFDPDPEGAPTQDIDDKLILQKAGGHGEADYNLPSTPPNPWANHRVWWDRDGVDPWQNDETANTGGIYEVVITLHADDATSGTAYMTINGLDQGFETDGNWNTIELTPAGMTFSGDMTKMQVFYGLYGYGATHSVAFEDITVEGCLYLFEVDLDIKPGSYPNSINLSSKGVVPVAILGSDTFDVTDVDVATLKFGPDDAIPAHDLTDTLVYADHLQDVNNDGFTDLVCHFKTQELGLDEYNTEATLTGETYGGNPVEGTDTVNIVPKK